MSQTRSRAVRLVLILTGLMWLIAAIALSRGRPPEANIVEVFPGEDIQAALEAVSRGPGKGTVRVRAGTYRPRALGEALVYFNSRHDGVTVEAVGDVVLTAENRELSDPRQPGYPAAVNHVVYFGDGVSRKTVLRGFTITGANGLVSGPGDLMKIETMSDLLKSATYRAHTSSPIESNTRIARTHYFYTDGGGILVHGRSYPTIENVEVRGNYASVCGGGVSVQHPLGSLAGAVLFKDCIFRDNRAAVSGSAVDLLIPGSWAILENCLFVGNLSNSDLCPDVDGPHGALTVFPGCRATVTRCTFTDNRNGVDDRGIGSTYRDTIFWHNDRAGGACVPDQFEFRVRLPSEVRGCVIGGSSPPSAERLRGADNALGSPDPAFDSAYRPHHRQCKGAGWRPRRSPG